MTDPKPYRDGGVRIGTPVEKSYWEVDCSTEQGWSGKATVEYISESAVLVTLPNGTKHEIVSGAIDFSQLENAQYAVERAFELVAILAAELAVNPPRRGRLS